ncbi:hypothetical protein IT084_10455 [Desulfallas sp. Bu1-1]|nr:hypothetical protein [Desulfallas sp. Bu1-1]MBF7083394.1 hypothetical protein [Desulfallas sp. Bu1-1]
MMMDDELSREEKLFWVIDGMLSKAVPFLLGFTVLYLLAYLVNFLQ